MNKSADSSPETTPGPKDADSGEKLEFPIEPDFLSLPPRLDPQVMLRRIAGNLPWRSARLGEQERRAALRIDVEFVL